NSCWQNARAKKPRLSLRASSSMMKAPASVVSTKIMSFLSRGDELFRPAQVWPEVTGRDQLFELIDTPEPRPLEVLDPKADRLVGLVQLLCALPRVPLGLEAGEHLGDPTEVRAVVAFVRAGAVGESDLAAGHGLLHDPGDLRDAEVLVVATHVECARPHRVGRSGEHGQEGACDVLDVHDRTPGGAVGLQEHGPRR